MKSRLCWLFIIGLVMIIMLCLGGSAAAECSHYVMCDQPDYCLWCESIVETAGITNHPASSFQYEAAGDKHRVSCGSCGDFIYETTHEINCNDTSNQCMHCKAALNDEMYYFVWHNTKTVNYGDYCASVCEWCDKEDRLEHLFFCYSDLCQNFCGAICDLPLGERTHDYSMIRAVYVDEEYHSNKCFQCGYVFEEKNQHRFDCVTSGESTCSECHEATSSDPAEWYHSDIEYCYFDWLDHKEICSNCGYEEKENHWDEFEDGYCDGCGCEIKELPEIPDNDCVHSAYCDDPNYCIYCGTRIAGTDFPIIGHSYDALVYTNKGNIHEVTCSNCDTFVQTDKHSYFCTEGSDVCHDCGGEITGEMECSVRHADSIYVSVGEQCKSCCRLCGGEEQLWDHAYSCVEPGRCMFCGETEYAPAEIVHNSSYRVYTYDDAYHYPECLLCGEVFEKKEHSRFCAISTQEGVCTDCMASDVTIKEERILHFDYYEYVDFKCHNAICIYCEDSRPEAHYDEDCDGYCEGCAGTVKVSGDVNEDDEVNIVDALLLVRSLAGFDVEINRVNADCNGDGVIDLDDALVIFQWIAGYDVELK